MPMFNKAISKKLSALFDNAVIAARCVRRPAKPSNLANASLRRDLLQTIFLRLVR